MVVNYFLELLVLDDIKPELLLELFVIRPEVEVTASFSQHMDYFRFVPEDSDLERSGS